MLIKILINALIGFVLSLILGFVLQRGIELTILIFVVTGVCLILWIYSLIKPLHTPWYKYIMPIVLPLVWTIQFGIVGFSGAYLFTIYLQYVAEDKRLFLIDLRTTAGMNILGRVPYFTIIRRTIFGHILAGIAVGILIYFALNVGTYDMGSGRFSSFIPSLSSNGNILALGALGGLIAFFRHFFEAIMAYFTATRKWRYPGSHAF